MTFAAGIARTCLTPFWGVELTGWGYYIERRWRRIRDHLQATSLVVDDGHNAAVLVALDLMVIDDRFTRVTRERIAQATGIPAEALPRLFSRFYRAPNVDSEHISGMGIGLYVVNEIVTLHGGVVEVDSMLDAGSTFTVRLPLIEQPVVASQPAV